MVARCLMRFFIFKIGNSRKQFKSSRKRNWLSRLSSVSCALILARQFWLLALFLTALLFAGFNTREMREGRLSEATGNVKGGKENLTRGVHNVQDGVSLRENNICFSIGDEREITSA